MRKRFALLGLMLAGLWVASAWAQPVSAERDATASSPAASQDQSVPAIIFLEPRQIRSMAVEDVKRIAVGDPDIVDVTIVSSNEVLLHAKAAGTTNLILWDHQGQRVTNVEVVDRLPEALEAQLRQLLTQLNVPGVQVKREHGKLFLIGQVFRKEEFERLEQMLSAYPGVTNLAQISESAPAPSLLPPLVKLSVQVIEINRSDLERLGVRWSESVAFTEPEATDRTAHDALLRWGTSLTRGSTSWTLNALVKQNRARILAEPKLVTANGKQASSFIGVEVPVITATTFSTTTSAVSTSIEFRQTGVLLKMTPNIHTSDHKITTAIEAEVSSVDNSVALSVPVGNQTVAVPGFSVRKANTEVTTASGETVMIAGLLQTEDTKDVSQVPGLGGMPVVGRLFRSPETESTQRELVIAVTPELLGEEEVSPEKALTVEEALSVAENAASAENPRLRYVLQVEERIAKSLRYPTREKDLNASGQVKLRVHLLRDGTLKQAVISESSGFEAFDQAALNAARSQSPFPPFPSDLTQGELWLELPVLFRP
ncbi:MAG: TonB family protein [Candidatus Omnitrophica bacterium]|nr:TonB family protein [Candidatus Omnitrophota bacterium]